jgi:DNA-binding LacI/PurR family transcriptional regulator
MANSRAPRPTMLDVAKLAGVSYQTVSRVINDHPYVSDETRQRVQEAIDTLGYHPSKAAVKLASKSSKTIAIIIYGSWFHGPVQIALNIEIAAKTSGFDVILASITEPRKQLVEALRNVKSWAADGVLMIIPVESLPLEEVQAICGDTPFVLIETQRSADIPSVVMDDVFGTEQVVEHLIAQGHTGFCHLSGPMNWFSAQARHATAIKTLHAHGLDLETTVEANWTAPGGYQAMRRLLESSPSFTALISANDNMAFGALFALKEAGLSVPDDVSIIGFDDVPEAAYYTPPLTTVRQNHIQLGIVGFEYLMQLMDDPDTPIKQHIVTPKVIFRESTREPALA